MQSASSSRCQVLSRVLRHVKGVRTFSGLRAVSAAADATIARTNRLFIDNKYEDASGGLTLSVVSPRDGKAFTTIPHASSSDVDRAVAAARRCFDSSEWSTAAATERANVLRDVAARLRDSSKLEEMALIETLDCGKTLGESKGDIEFCAEVFEYYADVAPERFAARELELPEGEGGAQDFSARIQPEPLGVVGCVTPWNYPLMQAVMKVAPALAAGCSVVLKPSPIASLTCCALGEVVREAGLPAGALNVITGGPPEMMESSSTGQFLIDHEGLDKISFTGSGGAGRRMLEASAPRLRPTALELGGKSAFVIFDDAEEYLDAIVDWVMVGIFSCTGQVCSATSRVIVHKDIEAALLAKLKSALEMVKVGDPMVSDTMMGPVVSEGQQKLVMRAIQQAGEDGCTVHLSELFIAEDLKSGFYVPPAILTDVPVESRAWRNEIFGPVLAIRSFSTEAEAVALANDTPYGLGNAVYSADEARRTRVASKLKSGVVWENCSNVLFAQTPFGGRVGKASGFGFEYGIPGLLEFISEKTIVTNKVASYHTGTYVSGK
eukprot:TRINITY_DN23078_c0_g1_i1.p1 TRINITY_DN23078_c0_g1~~TRINITY_DN23078_c0_g1_i1.p1  ORF type:complete len:567 (+),score=103.27 TRINITY_DN23078_c0_g1_i1:51-1703(+)